MNKTKKIAIAAVSLVMAGSMALGIVGCGGGNKATYDPKLDENGALTYTDGAVTLNLNIGNYNKDAQQGISYTTKDLSGNTVLPDGKTYGAGMLKPAWQAVQDLLKINLADKFQNMSSDNQIVTPAKVAGELAKYDLVSGSLAQIVTYSDQFLELGQYLKYMPNYSAFLDANPVTRYSLTGNTSGGMFAAPYFDGNDDIEKYTMVNYNLVEELLGGSYTSETTYKKQLEEKKKAWPAATTDAGKALGASAETTYAEAYMGTTGNYTVKTTPIGGNEFDELVDAKVDYAAANTAAKDADTPLGAAVEAAAGKAYTGESGNIVDIMNFAIKEAKGEVTGTQLAKILVAYIDVAYTVGGKKYDKAYDVFTSASAAWDVDLLVALSRVAVTKSVPVIGSDGKATGETDYMQYAISARETTTQRRVDLLALAGELYGVRGLESRYEYAYFDKDGQLQDARENEDTFNMLARMSTLAQEGLVLVGGLNDKGEKTSINTANTSGDRTMLIHDYAQTQTKAGLSKKKEVYNFGPIVTAVSKWDTTGDGTHDTTMRFTESWRSVKNTGFAVPKAAVVNNPEKLSAVLTLIDYMFSVDGQLLLSYGPQSMAGNETPNGWWYATDANTKYGAEKYAEYESKFVKKVADAYGNVPAQYAVKTEEDGTTAEEKAAIKAARTEFFVYNGKGWVGMAYNGRNVPIITSANREFFLGKEVTVGSTKIQQGKGNIAISKKEDYTNYARYVIGSTLPVGNKDQGFEYQATAQCGLDGAAVVNVALQNGTLKHVKLTLASGESPWYLIVPTALPLTAGNQAILKNSTQDAFGHLFYNSSTVPPITNVAIDILYYGLGNENIKPLGETTTDLGANYKNFDTAEKLVAQLKTSGLTQRLQIMQSGWKNLNVIYSELNYV